VASDAIWAALRANGGNKVKTAAYLGISHTTLYKALRSLASGPEPTRSSLCPS
jgi:DNA-binding NtrC family response regulator